MTEKNRKRRFERANTLILTLVALMVTTTMMAVPAKKGTTRTVRLADGTTVELALHGDEHYSYYKDANGKPCQVENGRIRMISKDEIATKWAARKEARLKLETSSRRGAARRAGEPSKATTGTQKGLVILVEFNDVKFKTANPKTVFQNFFNKEGYSDYGMSGSVRDYFLKQSYGQLTIDFDVVGPYTTKNDMEYYGGPEKDSNGETVEKDKDPVSMVAEAVDAASKDVNFADYDWDKDGEVDQVFVIYAGYGEAQGAEENTIWPHEWQLAAGKKVRRYNNVVINTYGCAAELKGSRGSTIDGIGTACHEFSHCLGLPDMYDTSDDGDAYGMCVWDIMDHGSYNGESSGCTPAGYTSYERWFASWLEPKELNSKTTITGMKPLAREPEAYVMYNDKNHNEYYLLENRQLVDFDSQLYGHGLLILHVDYKESAWTNNTVNNSKTHQRMTIIPADNSLSYSSLKELQGDPWPGRSGNTALTNFSKPAATLFNNNTDGTKLMSKPIENITETVVASGENTISFVACANELDVPDIAEATGVESGTSYTVTWPAVAEAIGYEVELTTTSKAASTADAALVTEYDFSQCYSKTAGLTDISSKMSSYGMSGWSGSKLYTSPNLLRIGTSTAAGNLKSPNTYMTESSELTLVIGADVFTAGTPVKGTVVFTPMTETSYEQAVSVPFEVTGNQKLVFHFSTKLLGYNINIMPAARMYLNYLAIYDGTWTEEQLGIAETLAAPRRAVTVSTFTTTTNSYTFTDLSTSNKYSYRLRTLGESNRTSNWSEEKAFELTGSSESITKGDANSDGVVNTKDVVTIIDRIIGTSYSIDERAADVNGDGKIDVSDVTGVIGIIFQGK